MRNKLYKALLALLGNLVIQQIFEVVFTLILVRLLAKSDFGVIAIIKVVISFSRMVIDFGFGSAIIQNQNITKSQTSSIFFINLCFNTITTIIVYFSASFISVFFNNSNLEIYISATAFILFIRAFQFPSILISKDLNHKYLTISNFSSTTISNIIAIIMAFNGFGVWSLIIRIYIYESIRSFMLFYFSKWIPSKPTFTGLRPIFNFGLYMFGTKLFKFFSNNLVTIIVGKHFGSELLGAYNIAHNLAFKPAQLFQSTIGNILFTGFSKIQNDFKKFKLNFKYVLDVSLLLYLPVMMSIAGMSHNLVLSLFGSNWKESIILFQYLIFCSILRGIGSILKSAILSFGKADVLFKSTLIRFSVSILLMYLLIEKMDMNGLMIAFTIGIIISFFYELLTFNKTFNDYTMIFHLSWQKVILGMILFICSIGLGNSLSYSWPIELVIQVVLSLTIFVISLLTFFKNIVLYFKKDLVNLLNDK